MLVSKVIVPVHVHKSFFQSFNHLKLETLKFKCTCHIAHLRITFAKKLHPHFQKSSYTLEWKRKLREERPRVDRDESKTVCE